MNDELKKVICNKNVLIFDFDGTMVNTEYFNYLVHKKNWKKYGIELTEEEYKKIMGRTVADLKDKLGERYSNVTPQDLVNEYIDGFINLTKDKDMPLHPYAKEIFEKYGDKKIVILSNQSIKIIEMCLEKWGIKENISQIISLMNTTNKKIDYYSDTQKCFGAKQTDCVLFEDTQKYIDDGKACGIYTIGIKHQFNNPEADLVINVEQ